MYHVFFTHVCACVCYNRLLQVIDGMDTLDKMEKVPVDASDKPKQELRINRITIHANPLAG